MSLTHACRNLTYIVYAKVPHIIAVIIPTPGMLVSLADMPPAVAIGRMRNQTTITLTRT